MKIKAAVVREKAGPFVIEEIELDEPRPDEVLVRIVSSGLCHTDLVARMQFLPIPLPGVFGHEGAGVVEKVGSRVTKVKPGDHVATSYMSCGACLACKKGCRGGVRIPAAQLRRTARRRDDHDEEGWRSDLRLLLRSVNFCHSLAGNRKERGEGSLRRSA